MQETSNAFQKYLATNDTAANWGITCTTIGFQNVQKFCRYPLQQHPIDYSFNKENGRILNEYQLIYITQGKGVFKSASIKQTPISAGSMILIFPGEWHTYYPDQETGWKEYWIGFNGGNIDHIINSGFFTRENPIFNLGFHSNMIDLFFEVTKLAEKEKPGYNHYISGIIMNMLGYIYYKQKSAEFDDNPMVEKINMARTMMREKIAENIPPHQIAESLGVGYTWFRRTFKEYVGSSPGQYQLQLKHLRAKEMLNNGRHSISEICFALGFENISHFSTFFRKHEGISASQFRKNTFK